MTDPLKSKIIPDLIMAASCSKQTLCAAVLGFQGSSFVWKSYFNNLQRDQTPAGGLEAAYCSNHHFKGHSKKTDSGMTFIYLLLI